MSVASVEVILIAEALLINMSIPPNIFTVYSIALFIWSSNLTSQTISRAKPPNASISFAAFLVIEVLLCCFSEKSDVGSIDCCIFSDF